MDEYKFPCEPVANPESTVVGSQYRFTIIDNRVLRYEWAEDEVFEDRASTFAIFRKFPRPDFRVEHKDDQLEIITKSLHLTYDKKEFSPNGLVIECSGKLTDHGAQWRFGQPSDNNLGGTARTLDGVDGRCDMGKGIISRAGYATLDDSDSMLFDGSGFVTPRRPGKRSDGYIFSYGTDYKGAMESFYAISGRQPTVPRWCLGNRWSRYHAYDQAEYLALMDKFKANEVPLSVAVIDMDWHWVKEQFVPHTGWTGYTWNKKLFPDPKSFTQALHERGLKTTLNDHPHSGVHHHEEIYEELAQLLGHDTTHRSPIQFDPTSPKFMHAFFNVVHRRVENQGCDFWWIDWQQGSHTKIPGFDPLWLFNHFQFLDTKQSKTDSLPLIFSRYAGPGSHRYPVGFSGDTVASWASLQFQPEFTATASNIGYGWWSHDIGGHLPGYRDDECTARWVQHAVFSPILRLHSTASRWMSKEPWLYRNESAHAMKEAMVFRHRLVPYIYSINAAASATEVLVQPLYWNFPTRDVAYRFPNQYFFGPSLVVSPVVLPRNPVTNLAVTKTWIPPHRHVDIFTKTVYDGDRELRLYRSLDSITVLAPEGSIIPLGDEAVPSNGCVNPDSFEVLVVVGQDGRFDILEDFRDDNNPDVVVGGQRSFAIVYNQIPGQLSVETGGRAWSFRLISTRIDPTSIKVHVDGRILEQARCSIEGNDHCSDTVVKLPVDTAASKVVIELGPDPQLAVLNNNATLHALLRNFQTDIYQKDKIWEIIESDQPTAVKVGRLLSLDLEEAIFGPVAELLLADSRA